MGQKGIFFFSFKLNYSLVFVLVVVWAATMIKSPAIAFPLNSICPTSNKSFAKTPMAQGFLRRHPHNLSFSPYFKSQNSPQTENSYFDFQAFQGKRTKPLQSSSKNNTVNLDQTSFDQATEEYIIQILDELSSNRSVSYWQNSTYQIFITLLQKYGHLKQRQNMSEKEKQEYLLLINNLISRIPSGNKALHCFQSFQTETTKTQSTNPSQPPMRSVMYIGKDSHPLLQMKALDIGFAVIHNPDDESEFLKAIFIDTDVSPIVTILDLVHEYQHSCFSHRIRSDLILLEKTTSKSPQFNSLIREFEQNAAVEEVIAYTLETQFFIEFIQSWSRNFLCDHPYQSDLIKTKPEESIFSLGFYYTQLFDKVRTNSLAQFIIDAYVSYRLYLPENIYQHPFQEKNMLPELAFKLSHRPYEVFNIY